MSARERAEVFLKAARRVASGRSSCACWAVEDAANDYDTPERKAFAAVFRPRLYESAGFQCGFWLQLREEHNRHPDARHRRVVALCLAAAMASTGDL